MEKEMGFIWEEVQKEKEYEQMYFMKSTFLPKNIFFENLLSYNR